MNTAPAPQVIATSGVSAILPVVCSRNWSARCEPLGCSTLTVLVRAVPGANNSARLGARISRERVARTRISSMICQVAPTFHVETLPDGRIIGLAEGAVEIEALPQRDHGFDKGFLHVIDAGA